MPEVHEEPLRPAVVMETLPLFDMEPVLAAEPEPPEKLSAQRRRTLRQAALLKAGRHPLSGLAGRPIRLHPDAPPAGDRNAPGPRCGDCVFRELMPGGNRSYPKCVRGWESGPMHDAPLASHSAASDVRRYWPACEHWSAKP